MEIVS
jgi:hypothetical protein